MKLIALLALAVTLSAQMKDACASDGTIKPHSKYVDCDPKGWKFQGPALIGMNDGNGALEAFYTQGDTRELSRAWSCGLLEASKIMMEQVSWNPEAQAHLVVVNAEWRKAGCDALRDRIKDTGGHPLSQPPPGVGIDVQSKMPARCIAGQWYYAIDTDQTFACVKPNNTWKYVKKGEVPKK